MAEKWWGWGPPEERYPAPARDAFLAYLARRGVAARAPEGDPPPPRLPPSRLTEEEWEELTARVPASRDPEDRLAHSLGKGYLDLLRARQPALDVAADAVAAPGTVSEVQALLDLASQRGWALIPFGGGTSVLGGVRPLTGPHRAAVTVDLRRLHRVLEVDEASLLVRAEAGIRGPALEEALAQRGLTLGHFPQSFHFSTLGGWIATRSVGHLSGRFGRIEDLVRAVCMVTPRGTLETRTVPARATGPELRELLLGSEGTLGVVVEAVLRVRRAPVHRARRAFLLPTFAEGLERARVASHTETTPTLLRTSDEEETAAGLALSGLEVEDAGCIALVAFHGDPVAADEAVGVLSAAWTQEGALDLGPDPVVDWEAEYYRTPYLRDDLVARGVLVDTLETAAPWSRLEGLHGAVGDALRGACRDEGVEGIVLAHLSHAYRDGASLYFTILAPQAPGDEVGQWHRLKVAATEAILEGGGTLSHHHGIGVDHARWMGAEHGPLALECLRALKTSLDPQGILNPGKLWEGNG